MRRRSALRLLLAAGMLLTGCGDPPALDDGQLRIASLAPSISHIVIELGLADALVAVGDGDDIAPPSTPNLGRFNDLDLERLVTLAPTHVLAMTGQAGLPGRVTELAGGGRFALADLNYPATLDQALDLIERIGEALDRPQRAEQLAGEVRRRLDGIAALTAERSRPRALMVFATGPVMASGPGTVNDELLAIAGGVNADLQAAVTAPVYDREALWSLAPEVIFLMLPGDPPLSGTDDARLDAFRGLDLPAMENNRVILLNDPAVLHPGPSMATTAASMAVALHPDLAEAVAEVFRVDP